MRFRSEFGLTADLAYVRAVEASGTALMGWGIPLTLEEEQEMNRRARLADDMDRLNQLAYAIPNIAGVYFDQLAGGEVVIAVAGTLSVEEQSALVSRLPDGATYRFESVVHSLRSLNSLHERIIADTDALTALGVEITAVITNETENLVEVGARGDPVATQEVLDERYGSGLIAAFSSGGGVTTHAGCFDRNHCYGPPVKAGVSLAPPGWVGTADICSLAFTVNQSGAQRILTAGHSDCAGTQGDYHVDGFKIGTRQTRSWYDNETTETADAATIGNLTDDQDDNLLYHCSPTCYMSINGSQASDNNNIPVCLSARKAALIRCGMMIKNNASIQYPDGWLINQREATYAVWFGDSGGAAFSQTGTAYGVQSSCLDRNGNLVCDEGDTADNALYSHISIVFTELGGNMSIYTGN